MSDTTFSPGFAAPGFAPVAIPVREVMPWAIFGGLVLLMGLYFVGSEQGASSVFSGAAVHELLHDARHLLGFPCH